MNYTKLIQIINNRQSLKRGKANYVLGTLSITNNIINLKTFYDSKLNSLLQKLINILSNLKQLSLYNKYFTFFCDNVIKYKLQL